MIVKLNNFIYLDLRTEAITRDHKPDDKLEAERIYANGGRIDTYRDHMN